MIYDLNGERSLLLINVTEYKCVNHGRNSTEVDEENIIKTFKVIAQETRLRGRMFKYQPQKISIRWPHVSLGYQISQKSAISGLTWERIPVVYSFGCTSGWPMDINEQIRYVKSSCQTLT